MNHGSHAIQSNRHAAEGRGLSGPVLIWALAILLSVLWGLLVVGTSFSADSPPGSAGTPAQRGQDAGTRMTLRPVAVVYTQIEGRPFLRPRGISLNPETGEVLLADGSGAQVTIYSSDGVPVAGLGYNGELPDPVRAVAGVGGRIYVLNGNPRAIRMFNVHGEYLGDFELRGLEPGARVQPTALAADAEGNLLVGDSGQKTTQVLVYDPNGNLRLRFGSRGEGEGEFQIIVGLATDREGRIYVLEGSGRQRVVQIFSREGRFLRGWGQRAGGPTNFSQPVGIAISRSGHVVIADALRQTLQVYTQEGDFLGRFGGMGVMPGDLTFPSDVAADGTGRLYVTESVGQRFQILEMGNGSTTVNPGPIGPLAGDPREQVRAEVGAFSNSIRRSRK